MMDTKQSKKLSGEQEIYLDRAVATANNRYATFVGNQGSSKNIKTRHQNKVYEEGVNSFRNFINDYGIKLNQIFKRVGAPEVSDTNTLFNANEAWAFRTCKVEHIFESLSTV